MDIKKISCIIPMYNSEKTIERCLKSILIQNYNNYEIILVDDGSTDGTENLLKKYISLDNRIQYTRIINSGVSIARNVGIELSTGDYIMFIDSDDYLLPNAFKYFEESGQKDDLYIFSFKSNSKYILTDISSENCGIFTKNEILKRLLSAYNNSIKGYIWRCFFKRSVIFDYSITFPKNVKIEEDYLFMIRFVNNANKISIISKPIYFYCLNKKSTTSKFIASLEADLNYVNDEIINNVVHSSTNEKFDQFDSQIVNTYLLIINNLQKKDSGYGLIESYKHIKVIDKKYRPYIESFSFCSILNSSFRRYVKVFLLFYKFNFLFIYLLCKRIKYLIK